MSLRGNGLNHQLSRSSPIRSNSNGDQSGKSKVWNVGSTKWSALSLWLRDWRVQTAIRLIVCLLLIVVLYYFTSPERLRRADPLMDSQQTPVKGGSDSGNDKRDTDHGNVSHSSHTTPGDRMITSHDQSTGQRHGMHPNTQIRHPIEHVILPISQATQGENVNANAIHIHNHQIRTGEGAAGSAAPITMNPITPGGTSPTKGGVPPTDSTGGQQRMRMATIQLPTQSPKRNWRLDDPDDGPHMTK